MKQRSFASNQSKGRRKYVLCKSYTFKACWMENFLPNSASFVLHGKCPNTESFWSVSSCIGTENGDLRSSSVRIQENTDQKKLRIWTLFTPWWIYRINCDHYCYFTAQKMKFTIKDFFSKCDQIRRWFRVVFRICEKNP